MKSCYMESPVGILEIIQSDVGICSISVVEKKGTNEKGEILDQAVYQLEEYFLGRRKNFDVELDLMGTEFQKQVWKALMDIPYGQVCTYKQIAQRIGRPKAYRAVGMACNKNPCPIIVPCHRVIGTNQKLVGYAYGLEMKQYLLEWEREHEY